MSISSEKQKELDDFKRYLVIDKHQLDVEVSQQPELFYAVAEISAKYSGIASTAKAEMEESYASVSMEIRDELSTSGAKTTEKIIEHMADSNQAYCRKVRAYVVAKEVADAWQALVNAFNQRSHMLRELSNLYISGYYQSTSVRSTEKKSDDVVYEQRRQALADLRNNRTKP